MFLRREKELERPLCRKFPAGRHLLISRYLHDILMPVNYRLTEQPGRPNLETPSDHASPG